LVDGSHRRESGGVEGRRERFANVSVELLVLKAVLKKI